MGGPVLLTRLGRFTVAHRKAVLAGTVVFFIAAALLGGGVASRLGSGGFDDPASESSRAVDVIKRDFGKQQPDLVLLVTAKHGTVDDADVQAAAEALATRLAAEKSVVRSVSYWGAGSPPPLRSKDGRQALVLASLRGDEDQVLDAAGDLSPRYTRDDAAITVRVGGFGEVFRQVNSQVEEDLLRAELIAFPITLLLMVLVFGSVVAAGLPLVVGALAIVGTFLVLLIVSSLTEVSIFALNLTTGMGLGLAIDYSLFIVSRYREELHNGRAPYDAVVRTVQTAGKTVAFSALDGRGLARGAARVPARLLEVVRLRRHRCRASCGRRGGGQPAGAARGARTEGQLAARAASGPEAGGRGRLAPNRHRGDAPPRADCRGRHGVLDPVGPAVPADPVRPSRRPRPARPAASSRQVQDDIRSRFASNEAFTLQVVATDIGAPAARTDEIGRYAAALSQTPGAARVDALTGSYIKGQQVAGPGPITARFAARDATWLAVVPAVEPYSDAGERLAKSVRNVPAPFPVLVGGNSAELVDSKASLFSRLPLAAGLIALATFVLLFLMFGSVLVPIKALILNVLSLSATFGALVWIFQDGHLSGVLDFTPTGTLPATVPLLLFCLAFGLSMDYEVFLLSRIKEEHDRTGDNTRSVAVGLERTGRIVTAAAVLISVVFIAFATSGVSFIKIFGLGLTIAVLMDAFVIRATLVPAFMRIAGEANWWAPEWMRRIHNRIGISETEEPEPEPPPEQPAPEPVGSR